MALLGAALFAAVVAANPLWLPTVLERGLGVVGKSLLGGALDVEHTQGALWSGIELEGVRFRSTAPRTPLVELEVPRLRIDFAPRAFLRRGTLLERVLAFVPKVELAVHRVVLDLEIGSDEGTSDPGEPGTPFDPATLPALALTIEDAEVRLADGSLLRLHGLELDGRLDTGLDLSTGAFSIDGLLETSGLQAQASWNDDVLGVSHLELTSGSDSFVVDKLELPIGPGATPEEFWRTARGSFALDVFDLGATWKGAGDELPEHRVELAAHFEDGLFVLDSGSVQTVGGEFRVLAGRFDLRGARDLSAALLDVQLAIAFSEIAQLGQLLGRDDWRGRIEGELILDGPLVDPTGRLLLQGSDLTFEGQKLDTASIRAQVARGRVEVEELGARAPALTLAGSGTFLLREARLEDVALDVAVTALETLVPTAGVQGAAHMTLSAAGPIGHPEGLLALESRDLTVSARPIDSLRVRASFAGYDGLSVDELAIATPEGALTGAGRVTLAGDDVTVRLERLLVEREDERLELAGPVELALGASGFSVSPFDLTGSLGTLRGELRSLDQGLALRVELVELRPAPLLAALPLAGWSLERIDGSFEAALGSESALPTDWNGELSALARDENAREWSLQARLAQAGGRLTITEFKTTQAELGGFSIQGEVPFEPGSANPLGEGELALTITANAVRPTSWPYLGDLPYEPDGELELDAQLSGTWRAPRGSLSIDGRAFSILRPDGRLAGDGEAERLGPVALDLDLDLADGLVIRSGKLHTEQLGAIELDGRLDIPLDVERWRTTGSALLDEASMQAAAHLNVHDLAFLAKTTEALRRTSGNLTGVLEVSGTLAEPHVTGEFALEQGELRLASSFPAMKDLRGRVKVQDKTWKVVGLTGEFGASQFAITGEVDLGGAEPVVTIGLHGSDLLLFRSPEVRVRANANLDVKGPLSRLKTTGLVEITDGRFGQNFPLLAGLFDGDAKPKSTGRGIALSFWHEPPLSDMRFDVAVRTKTSFLIKNNLIKGGLRPDLRLIGTGEVPILNGPIFFDPTEIQLPSGAVEITSGLINFRANDPFVPKLELSAGARMLGYDIQARITGDYDDPEIELSSTPPLPNEPLLVLFLTGRLPEGSTGDVGMQAAQTVALYLTKDLLLRWFSGGEISDEESFFERLEFRIGEDVSHSGVQTTKVNYRLSGEARGPGRVLYLTGERDIYDKINFGYGIRFRFH